MKCPVCGAPAVDIGAKDFAGKVFRCSAKCKDYEISGTYMLKFLALSPPDRAGALARATTLAGGKRPAIDARSL